MTNAFKVVMVYSDSEGNFWQDTFALNAALLEVLRFARKNPLSECRIELRQMGLVQPGSLTLKMNVKRFCRQSCACDVCAADHAVPCVREASVEQYPLNSASCSCQAQTSTTISTASERQL